MLDNKPEYMNSYFYAYLQEMCLILASSSEFRKQFSQNKCSNYHEIRYTRHVYIIFYSFFQQNKNKFPTLNALGHYYKIFHIIKSKLYYYHIIKYFSTSPLTIANK